MAMLAFCHFFLLLLVVSVVSMVPGARARRWCSVEMDPNNCNLPACQLQCLQQYQGVGFCAHFGLQIFHCICSYFCP